METIDMNQLKKGEVNLGVCSLTLGSAEFSHIAISDLDYGRPVRQRSCHRGGQSYNVWILYRTFVVDFCVHEVSNCVRD